MLESLSIKLLVADPSLSACKHCIEILKWMVLARYQIVAAGLLGAGFLSVHCLLFFNLSSCLLWICERFSVNINNTLARYYTPCLAAVHTEPVGNTFS